MINPYPLFQRWLRLAQKSEINDPDAAALASVGADLKPDLRIVLIRRIDRRGFVFFSHQKSAKGRQIAHNANAALSFHWKSLRRQIRIRGVVHIIADDEADDYFAQRPRGHQLNAHASRQSRPLPSRQTLLAAFAAARKKFHRQPIPRPRDWLGYRLVPLEIEFWQSKRNRQHDRLLFYRATPGAQWKTKRLYP